MQNKIPNLLQKIIDKLRNPVLLFTISFGLILAAIGIYDLGKVTALTTPLVIVFIVGLASAIILQVLCRQHISDTTIISEKGGPHGIGEILPNRNATAKILSQVNTNTKKIKILAISGLSSTLSANVYEKLAPLRNTEIKCLLLSHSSNFVAERIKENPSRSVDGLRNHIQAGIDLLKTTRDSHKFADFHVWVYDQMPVLRLLFIDDSAYFSYYPNGPTDNTPVFVVDRSTSWLYNALEKHFDSLWSDDKRSVEVF